VVSSNIFDRIRPASLCHRGVVTRLAALRVQGVRDACGGKVTKRLRQNMTVRLLLGKNVVGEVAPDRTTVKLHPRAINRYDGGMHCWSQQQPR
jgi:hypothetical protein